jgi:PST family polysaccharide transporter
MFGFNMLKALVQNSDRLLIGYLLGANALGVYTFAWRVVVFPVRLLSSALGAYLFPKAARLQHDLDLVRWQYLSMMALLLNVILPVMVAVVPLAPLVVPSIFGAKWAPVVAPMQILTVTALAGAFYPLAGDLLKAMNRPGWMLAWSALYTGVTSVALWIGAQRELIGATSGLSAAHVLLLPVVLLMVDRAVQLRWRDVLPRWMPSLAGSLVLAAVMWSTVRFIALPSLSRAALALFLGMAAYLVTLGFLDPAAGRFLSGRTPLRALSAEADRSRE